MIRLIIILVTIKKVKSQKLKKIKINFKIFEIKYLQISINM